ncbi:MAG: hypothetical protein ACOX6T_24195 [Myxococcales bacterium]
MPSIAFAGDNMFVAVRSMRDRIKLYAPPVPVPLNLAIGPAEREVQASWTARPEVDDYMLGLSDSPEAPYDALLAIGSPHAVRFRVTGQSPAQTRYARLHSFSSAKGLASPSTEFVIKPFDKATVGTSSTWHDSGWATTAQHLGSRYLMRLHRRSSDGRPEVQWCDYALAGCESPSDWKAVLLASNTYMSADVYSLGDKLSFALVVNDGKVVYGTCNTSSSTCTTSSQWTTWTSAAGVAASNNYGNGKLIAIGRSPSYHMVLVTKGGYLYALSRTASSNTWSGPTRITGVEWMPDDVVLTESGSDWLFVGGAGGTTYRTLYIARCSKSSSPAVATNWSVSAIPNMPKSFDVTSTALYGQASRYYRAGFDSENGSSYFQSCAYNCTDPKFWHTTWFSQRVVDHDDYGARNLAVVDDTKFFAIKSWRYREGRSIKVMTCHQDCFKPQNWATSPLVELDTPLAEVRAQRFFDVVRSPLANKWQIYITAAAQQDSSTAAVHTWTQGIYRKNLPRP